MALATLMPQPLQPLIPSAEGIAALLMNIFFATVGAAGARPQASLPAPHDATASHSEVVQAALHRNTGHPYVGPLYYSHDSIPAHCTLMQRLLRGRVDLCSHSHGAVAVRF